MIKPYSDNREKSKQVRAMFDNIAPAYDFMNLAMTLGIDRRWRALTVKSLGRREHVLDVATGTGDLAILLARREANRVTGIDLAQKMVDIGRQKVKSAGLEARVTLGTGDCLALPFEDATFDGITCAFGVRNFSDLARGYKEMARVLKPGGKVAILELSTPTSPLVKPFYKFYTRGVIPLLGRLVSHDPRAYTYLPESIAAVPQRGQMTALMRDTGLENCQFRPLTLGVCTLYTATKPV